MLSVVFEIKFLVFAFYFFALIGVYAFLWWFIVCSLPVIQYIVASIKPYFKCQSSTSLLDQYGSWAGQFFNYNIFLKQTF
jgi:hypothetical protein